MRIVDFLRARIDDDFRHARSAYEPILTSRMLRETEAKQAILDRHQDDVWQIPSVSDPADPYEYEFNSAEPGVTLYYAGERVGVIAWETYQKRVGATRAIAPELIALARVYSDHPDYQEEWTE